MKRTFIVLSLLLFFGAADAMHTQHPANTGKIQFTKSSKLISAQVFEAVVEETLEERSEESCESDYEFFISVDSNNRLLQQAIFCPGEHAKNSLERYLCSLSLRGPPHSL
ncbi:MAG: hypothetical protein KDK41_05680 [Leptospiraceae bacterium]|nr:hypothetical protein [Leptospiraceae bacterium]